MLSIDTAKIQKISLFQSFFCRKVLQVQKKMLPLHPQIANGGVAQLVRASDS
jgi:hypothetical protein